MKKTLRCAKSLVNGAISRLTCGVYFNTIPLAEIFSFMERQGMTPIQEDGSKWEGFLCGDDGRASIHYTFEEKEATSILFLSWHGMQSGRYEIVSYIS